METVTDGATDRYSSANSEILRVVELLTVKDEVSRERWMKATGIEPTVVPENADKASIEILISKLGPK
jgi:hypothetical protein